MVEVKDTEFVQTIGSEDLTDYAVDTVEEAVARQISAGLAAALAGTTSETPISKVFDLNAWIAGGEANFVADRRRLYERIVVAGEAQRNLARMDLARFYLAHGLDAEALGVLRAISNDDPKRAEQPDFLAVRGAASYLMHRPEDALADLSSETLKGSNEAQFWRALVITSYSIHYTKLYDALPPAAALHSRRRADVRRPRRQPVADRQRSRTRRRGARAAAVRNNFV